MRLNGEKLLGLLNHQLYNFWGGDVYLNAEDIEEIERALQRMEKCFAKVNSKYFRDGEEVIFKVENSVQYAIFLYLMSNELYISQKEEKASFVYYLNKIMNSVEWFYAVKLPEYFCAEHPLGSVLGRATYGNYFYIYQDVTVGGSWKENEVCYPIIGEHVTMFSNSKVLGKAYIGNNTVIAANTYIINTAIPDNSMVFGQSPNLIIKQRDTKDIEKMFKEFWISGS